MSLLADLNIIAGNVGIAVETGVFSGTAPTEYLVLTPLSDSFDVHADNDPGVDVQQLHQMEEYPRPGDPRCGHDHNRAPVCRS